MKKVFDLQLFAGNDDIVIPEEFDGIDRDIALELMKENGLLGQDEAASESESNDDTSDGDSAPEQKPETEESQDDDSQDDDGSDSSDDNGNDDSSNEDDDGDSPGQDDDDSKKTVPLAALKAERGKRQKTQKELETTRAELEALRSQQQAPPSSAQQQQATPPNNPSQQKSREEIVEEAALEMFKQKNDGREPDELNRGDNIKLMMYANEVERSLSAYEQQQARAISQSNQIRQSYQQFVNDQKTLDDFEELQSALVEKLQAMPETDMDRQVFIASLQRCESGNATPQDVFIVKKFWNDNASAFRSGKQKAETKKQEKKKDDAPPPKKKTAAEKLNELEKHTKANLVHGSSADATPNLDALARKLQEGKWEDLSPEEQELLRNLPD